MLPTGFQISNGNDLSTIFEPIGTGPMYTSPTGFVTSTGKDLRELFAVRTTLTIPNDTKFITQNGQDLRQIFQGIEPLTVTIGGSGVYTENITGNKRTYTFTNITSSETSNYMRINKNVTLHVIVVGGGGPGAYGSPSWAGGGGGAGGFGYVSFSYASGQDYYPRVANFVTQTSGQPSGGSSSFLNNSGQGPTATGGQIGARDIYKFAALPGTFTVNGPGTVVTASGGGGGRPNETTSNVSGENSRSITVLGVTYNYGGGGASGMGTESTGANRGGNPGLNGTGGSGSAGSVVGASALISSPGSGGGGAGWAGSSPGGNGGPGLVIVIFTYP